MDTPISWIKAYVPDLDCTPQEYADKMTLSGSNMESVTYLDKNLVMNFRLTTSSSTISIFI